jgi:DNA-binding NarL/FixJ family response regulator
MGESVKVLLLDIEEIYRLVIENVFSKQPLFSVIVSEDYYESAYNLISANIPSIVIMDLNFKDASFESINNIKAKFPTIKTIVLTNKKSTRFFLSCFKAGAKGFITKKICSTKLTQIVHKIHMGDCYADPAIASRTIANQYTVSEEGHCSLLSSLTPRERQVLLSVANGKTNKEIAIKLNITERTVKYYMTNIMQKLQVKNRLEAALTYKNNQAENQRSLYN